MTFGSILSLSDPNRTFSEEVKFWGGIYLFDKPGHIKFRYDEYVAGDPENKRIIYGRDIVMVNNNEAVIYTAGYKLDHFDFQKKELRHIDSASK